MSGLDDVREEFREGWREGMEHSDPREELRRFGSWLRRAPGALARFTLGQLRALWTVTVALLRDALRGSPILVGILGRALLRAVRAGLRAGAGAEAAAPAPAPSVQPDTKAPATDEEDQEQPAKEQALAAEGAPARPPWKARKSPAKPSPKQAPAAPQAPARGGVADLLERFALGFLALAVLVAFGGIALGQLARFLAPYASGIYLGAAVVWCVAAAIVAHRADQTDEEEETDEEDDDPTGNDHETSGEERQETDPWPAVRTAVRECVEEETAAGAAGYRDAKGRGVRIDDLVAPLQCRRVTEAVDRKAVIALLERAGIPYREQMKFRLGGKQKNAPGVHVDDLAKDLGYRPRLPARLVPDLTPQPGPSRELKPTR